MLQKTLFIIALYLLIYHNIIAQNKVLRYDFATDIPFFTQNNQPLPLALAGGLNAPQFSTIDLNGDNRNDLFVFDRTANRIYTFLNENNRYRYAPEYEILFPAMRNWCLLLDYDKDGKKDIFTTKNGTVSVYKNISLPKSNVTFVQESKNLTTKSFSSASQINIGIDATDIPAITDIDNDGDVDILFFTPSFGVTVEFAKNMSVEKYRKADSLEFEKTSIRWGSFEECSVCNEYKFGNENCSKAQKDDLRDDLNGDLKANNSPQILRVEHSGSTQLVIDLDGNGLKDMLIGDVSCNNLAAFFNKGTQQDAKFDAFLQNFPQIFPVNMPIFPAAYYEDVDFDGLNDLLVAPNVADNSDKLTNFRQSIWFYKNVGTNNTPVFNFQKTDFLQGEMLDIGENTKPIIVDVNADGKLDLLLANSSSLQTDKSLKTQLFYYQNTGTNQQPSFKLQDENLYNFLTLNGLNLRPTFADLNNDNALDLIFSISTQQNLTTMQYVLNENLPNQPLNFDLAKRQNLNINSTFRPLDEPLFVDLNNDNFVDLLIGRLNGNLEYWENTGDVTNPANPNFVLRNARVGGITTSATKTALSLAVADLTNDNKLELITGDGSGNLRVYENFADNISGNINENFTEITNIIRHKISNLQLSYFFGRATCPAILGNNIFVGTSTGGLQYLRFGEVITGIENENTQNNLQTIDLQVFPNPATHSIQLKSNQNLQIKLYNLLGQDIGQKIGFNTKLEANQTLILNIETLPKGLYLLESVSRRGERHVKKIVIE